MSIPLRIVEQPTDMFEAYKCEAGDMFLCWNGGGSHDVEGRDPCWVIRLPGEGRLFHTNMQASSGGYWTVTGEAPNLTVNPSINVGPEIWHGWITDGALAPDVDNEGRR